MTRPLLTYPALYTSSPSLLRFPFLPAIPRLPFAEREADRTSFFCPPEIVPLQKNFEISARADFPLRVLASVIPPGCLKTDRIRQKLLRTSQTLEKRSMLRQSGQPPDATFVLPRVLCFFHPLLRRGFHFRSPPFTSSNSDPLQNRRVFTALERGEDHLRLPHPPTFAHSMSSAILGMAVFVLCAAVSVMFWCPLPFFL